MDTMINERVTGSIGASKGFARSELVPAQVREVLNLRRLQARLTGAQAAALLNCGEHDIPVLVSSGLLKPLGHPPPNAVKYFAPTDVLEMAGDSKQMSRVCDAIYEHWRCKNANKSNHGRKSRSTVNAKASDNRNHKEVVTHRAT